MTDVVIAAYRRSPFHLAHKGELDQGAAGRAGGQVIRTLVAEAGVDPARSRTWCSAAPSRRASRG